MFCIHTVSRQSLPFKLHPSTPIFDFFLCFTISIVESSVFFDVQTKGV